MTQRLLRFYGHARLTGLLVSLLAGGQAQAAVEMPPQRGFGGREVRIRFVVTDAPGTRTTTTASVVLIHNDLVLARGQVDVPLTNGWGEGTVTVTPSPVQRPVRALLSVTVEGRKTRQPFWIFPPPAEAAAPAFASPQVVFVDTPSAVRELAQAVNGRARFVASKETLSDDWRIAVVNVTERRASVRSLRNFWREAENKKQVVIFVGDQAGVDGFFDFNAVPGRVSIAVESTDHSLLQEISPEWTTGWEGAKGLTLPEDGDFRALTVWNLTLPPYVLTPLLEVHSSPLFPLPATLRSRTLHCSLPLLQRLNDDPAAGSLLTALVRYAAELAATPALSKEEDVILVDPATADVNVLRRALATGKKRTVVLAGLQPDDLAAYDWLLPAGATLEPSDALESVEVQRDPLTVGLTSQWLWQAAEGQKVNRLRVAPDASVRWLVQDGLAAAWEKHGAQGIVWQLPLHTALGRAALRQMLTNAGVSLREKHK